MTLKFVMEMMTVTMRQNQKTIWKNFLQPRKRKSKRFKKPSMQKMKGLENYLWSCLRSKGRWILTGSPGQVIDGVHAYVYVCTHLLKADSQYSSGQRSKHFACQHDAVPFTSDTYWQVRDVDRVDVRIVPWTISQATFCVTPAAWEWPWACVTHLCSVGSGTHFSSAVSFLLSVWAHGLVFPDCVDFLLREESWLYK